MIAKTCEDFLEQEVYPHLDEIDDIRENPKLMPGILDKAGNWGYLGTSVPQEYGGLAWISTPPCWWLKKSGPFRGRGPFRTYGHRHVAHPVLWQRGAKEEIFAQAGHW